ncbi:hypothetical protein DUI87_03009 [Hirundo rustica rustica]|uniref:ribonuclease H n=1 Tax=Hirundo rustica rustica TaxID=333673 RepID=A0A3M0LAU2_HIRRU|nr:hypothetical protein DUI87_03009 [Hirundo rustica rustica]
MLGSPDPPVNDHTPGQRSQLPGLISIQNGVIGCSIPDAEQPGVEELLVHRMYRGLWEFVNHPEWQRDCGMRSPSDPLVLAREKDNKATKGNPKRCCSTCSINQRCTHPDKVYQAEALEQETEDVLKPPPRRQERRRVVGDANSEPSLTPTSPTSSLASSSFGRTAIEVGVSPPTPKPREPPKFYPPLPSSDSEWDEPEPLPPGPKLPSQGPIASRTQKQTREVIQAPLRRALTSDGETKLIKVPFSSIDLEIWKRIAKGYRSDPIGVAKKMKFMIKQHSPDWADLQLLLDALTETEEQLVLKVAGDLAEDDCRTTEEDVKDVFPLQDPGWDPNDDEGLGRLKRHQELIVKGLERAIPKTINWSALYAIKQGPSQTPSEFLDHLRDAMRQHTTLDPGSDEGMQQLINLFLGQSTRDIRQKLQKIRGPNSQNLETLLDEAWRVFSNREEGYKQGMKKLVAVVKEGEKGKHGQGPPKQGPPQLGKDQCAFCKKFGHWKNQCPELRKDLKDVFFCLPLHEASQKMFAFEWESPKTGRKTQLTWCMLPQGYKNSPIIFGEQLAKDLESWEPPPGEGQLLQYVDDLLIATRTQETCVDWTDRKEAICQTPKPQTVKELRTFLGMTGWCRLWIYNYGLLVKPLYALITEGSRDLQWTKDATRAFDQLKKALMSAPALGLPNASKPFFLFSHEKQGIALGILAQNIGPYRRAVAYLSKQLDTAAKGWPGCLRAVAAVAINIQEARKFTLGQKMTVLVSHTMSAVLEAKGGHWLSPQRFLKYQAILVEQDDVEIVVTNIVNSASFLSGSMGEPVIHDCLETIEATYSSRPDLKDTPLEDAETWFTDGSSYVVSGRRHAGYAVTTSKEVIESGPLPTNTSAQKAEIIALIRALELAKGKEINSYTDSRYAFRVVHAHGAIWKERGLLNSQGKSIKHAQEILRLLDAIQLPEKVAIMYIKAHQKVSSELEEGNMLADREAKEAAKGEVPDKAVEAALIPDGKVSVEGKPVYNKKDKKLIKVCPEYHKKQTKITPPVPRKAMNTNMPAIPEVEEQITPVVTKIGPYAIKKTGVQKLIVNPKWSLKRVEMGVQVTVRPTDRGRFWGEVKAKVEGLSDGADAGAGPAVSDVQLVPSQVPASDPVGPTAQDMAGAAASSEGLQAFPVLQGTTHNTYQPSAWQALTELRDAVRNYGLGSAEVMQVLHYFDASLLMPFDIQSLARALFPPVEYDFFEHKWTQLAVRAVERNKTLGPGDPRHMVNTDMLLGTGNYARADGQAGFEPLVQEQCQQTGMAALVQTIQLATPQESFVTIIQGADEPFLCFAGRLTAAVEKQVSDPAARKLMLQSLARSNCNAVCKRIIEALHGEPSMSQMVEACARVTPSSQQMVAVAMAVQPAMTTVVQLTVATAVQPTVPTAVQPAVAAAVQPAWIVPQRVHQQQWGARARKKQGRKHRSLWLSCFIVHDVEGQTTLRTHNRGRSRGDGGFGSTGPPQVRWTAVLTKDRPETLCTVSMAGAMPSEIHLRSLLDARADVSILSLAAWPAQWPLTLAKTSIAGLGGTKQCYVSQNPVAITNLEGQMAIIWPHVTEIAQNLWGRDVLAAWGVRLGTDF